MKPNNFVELLDRFSEQAIPAILNRHMYVWIGKLEDLLSHSPAGLIKRLDLHTLCKGLTKIPLGERAAGRELVSAIEAWLLREFPSSHHQRVLLVTGLDLLYRYRISLSVFFQMANENTMIILYLSELDVNFRPIKPLPDYIQFSPHSIMKYVSAEIPEEAIVKEE